MPALMYGSTRTHQWNRGRLGRPIVVFYLADVGDPLDCCSVALCQSRLGGGEPGDRHAEE